MMDIKKIVNIYILNVIKDPERKPLHQIVFEAINFSIKKRTFPISYITRLLYKKYNVNYLDFISNKTVYSLQKKLNNPEFIPILKNKYIYDIFFKHCNLPLPHTLAYNTKELFFYNSKNKLIRNGEEFQKFLLKLLDHCKDNRSIFIKTVGGAWGTGARKIEKEDIENFELINNLYHHIIAGEYIFQETMIQNKHLSALYPHSLNSIRIDTYLDNDGKAHVMSAFLRVGANKSIVDNVSLGGYFISIDLDSGKLKENGMSLIYNGAPISKKHPETGVVFKDFEIPYFEKVKEIVIRAAEYLPGIRLIGWDVVISKDGPVLLEGNHDYHMGVLDIAYGGYHNNPVFKKMVSEAGLSLENA